MSDIDNLVTASEAQTPDNPQAQNDVLEAVSETPPVTTEEEEEADDTELDDVTKERYKQQIEGSKKEVERLKGIVLQSAIKNAEKDASTLLELHKTDPKLASKAAEHFDWSKTSWGSYKSFLKQDATVSKSLTDEEIEALAEEKAQAILAKKEHEKAVSKAEKMFKKLDDDLQEEALTRFTKLVGSQLLNEDEAVELAEMATLYVTKNKGDDDRYKSTVASFASSGVSTKSKKPSGDDMVSVIRDGKIVLVPSNTLL